MTLDYINNFTSGCWQAPASMAEWRMTLSRLTFAGERSRSAITRWGAPKMCPVLERSSLTNNKNMVTLTKALYIYEILTRVTFRQLFHFMITCLLACYFELSGDFRLQSLPPIHTRDNHESELVYHTIKRRRWKLLDEPLCVRKGPDTKDKSKADRKSSN